MPCTHFKATQKNPLNDPVATPPILRSSWYIRLLKETPKPCRYLTRSFYTNCRTRPRRPISQLRNFNQNTIGFASNLISKPFDTLASESCSRPHVFHHCLRSSCYNFTKVSYMPSIAFSFNKNSFRTPNDTT